MEKPMIPWKPFQILLNWKKLPLNTTFFIFHTHCYVFSQKTRSLSKSFSNTCQLYYGGSIVQVLVLWTRSIAAVWEPSSPLKSATKTMLSAATADTTRFFNQLVQKYFFGHLGIYRNAPQNPFQLSIPLIPVEARTPVTCDKTLWETPRIHRILLPRPLKLILLHCPSRIPVGHTWGTNLRISEQPIIGAPVNPSIH